MKCSYLIQGKTWHLREPVRCPALVRITALSELTARSGSFRRVRRKENTSTYVLKSRAIWQGLCLVSRASLGQRKSKSRRAPESASKAVYQRRPLLVFQLRYFSSNHPTWPVQQQDPPSRRSSRSSVACAPSQLTK